jgi:hypothetical protein
LRSNEFCDVLDWSDRGCFGLHYRSEAGALFAAFNVSGCVAEVPVPQLGVDWRSFIDSASTDCGGEHEPRSLSREMQSLSLQPQSFFVAAT